MTGLFPALEARFNGDFQLVSAGRKLYQGYGGKPYQSGPHTEVTLRRTDSLDGFDADIEVYRAEFRCFTQSINAEAAERWCERMTARFDDGQLESSQFTVCGMEIVDQPKPFVDEMKLYGASCLVQIVLQRTTNQPLVRAL